MEKLFEDLDSLLKQVCSLGPDHSGLRHKANGLAQRLHKAQNEMRSGKCVFHTMKEFWVFWSDGKYNKISGYDVADAFRKAGYGSVAAVDFHMQIPHGDECLEGRLTFPGKEPARGHVVKHFIREIREALMNLRENRGAAVFLVKMEDFRELIESLTPAYMQGKNDDVAAEFQKLYDELLAKPSQDGAIQRGE